MFVHVVSQMYGLCNLFVDVLCVLDDLSASRSRLASLAKEKTKKEDVVTLWKLARLYI